MFICLKSLNVTCLVLCLDLTCLQQISFSDMAHVTSQSVKAGHVYIFAK